MPLDVRTYSVHSGSNPHTVGQELETLVLIWTSRAKGRWAWRGWAGERWVEVETFAEAESCPPGGGAAAEVTWLDVARRNTQVRPFFASTTLTCSSFKIVEILNWFHSLSVSRTLSLSPLPPPHTRTWHTLSLMFPRKGPPLTFLNINCFNQTKIWRKSDWGNDLGSIL